MIKLTTPLLLLALLGCGDEVQQPVPAQVRELSNKFMHQEIVMLPKGQRFVSLTFQGSAGIPWIQTREKHSSDQVVSPQKYEIFPVVGESDFDDRAHYTKYVIQEQD